MIHGSSCLRRLWARLRKSMHENFLAWCQASGRHPVIAAVVIEVVGKKRHLEFAACSGVESEQKL